MQKSDIKLLKRIQEGDKSALREIYNHNFPQIKKLIRRKGGSSEDAKDTFQEVIIIFYEKVVNKKFDAVDARISTYIYEIARRQWLSKLKKTKVIYLKDTPEMFSDDQLFLEDVVPDEKILEQVLAKLSDRCRGILIAYYYQLLSMEAIAEEYKLKNAGSAKTKKHKCIQKAREILQQLNIQQ